MKFSIIIPSYNQGHFIEKTLLSILDQRFPETEIIVIDGGSTDDTVEVLKRYDDDIHFWASEKDNGQSHAVNKGLQHAKGDIIGWINSDDIYIGNAIEQARQFFTESPATDIVFANYYFIDENDNIIQKRREIPFDFYTYLWTEDCYHANCAGFFRKRVFDKCGGLREDLQYTMDLEFYLRASANGFKFSQLNRYWGAFRAHQDSKTTSHKNMSSQQAEGQKIFSEYNPQAVPPIKRLLYRQFFDKKRKIRKLLNGYYF